MSSKAVARHLLWVFLVAMIGMMLHFGTRTAEAARVSDVRGTKHNLSAAADGSPSGSGTVPVRTLKASTETQICVFCHTPHGATGGATPLWNRKVAGQGYTQNYVMYDSATLDAKQIQGSLNQPGGSSKLCLSCHDGTIAIGSVNVLNGLGSQTTPGTQHITMSSGGTLDSQQAPHKMPVGAGADTGFTRNLGTDLTNDHPISITFDNTLAMRDGELRAPDGILVGPRTTASRPKLPLERVAEVDNQPQVQCVSCHDPHIREQSEATVGNQKFLRLNRFQEKNPPSTSGFDATVNNGDIICIACHEKNGLSGSWAYSAHANPLVANQTYKADAASRREFPAGMQVWKASCLNCHDTHSVAGSRHLLREGTDSLTVPKSGGSPAIEETCFQCHVGSTESIIEPSTKVPNIKSDYGRLRTMPIRSANQPAGSERHEISASFNDAGFIDCTLPDSQCGKDFMESRARLGVGNPSNRHAECTDCHNPHRVVKFRDFRGAGGSGILSGDPDPAGTHKHTDDATTVHTNIASGVLRGAWGVEPEYGSASFTSLPTGYKVKRGDPGNSTDISANAPYVTREYQICLKCHSDYGYSDNEIYPVGNRPSLGSYTGGTPSGTNNLTQYTNQAREFQAPAGHKGQPALTNDSGAGTNFQANNHRSWHPVIDATGRTPGIRNADAVNWLFPWRNAVGTQTMYCTDCHGSGVASGAASVIPTGGEDGNPWGPHGSDNNFILKGTWSATTGTGATHRDDGLCFKCHSYALYVTPAQENGRSGFSGSKDSNLHGYHALKIQLSGVNRIRCSWCHVAVPHGWKNKALLVNLNDVGPEVGLPAGTQVRNNTTAAYNREPYYLNAMNKVHTFAASGNWEQNNCGSRGAPGNGERGVKWMKDSTENCQSPP